MKIQFSDGREMKVGCYHTKQVFPRETWVYLKDLKTGVTMEAFSRCSPKDNFCKRVGRKIAACKLLDALRQVGLGKEDRGKVFRALCPDLKGGTP